MRGEGSGHLRRRKSGRRFIGVELTQQWFDVACRRMEAAMNEPRLFGDHEPEPTQAPLFG